jgi:hypothetical protein
VTEYDSGAYSVHFAHCAAKLEAYLLRFGVTCTDADSIIEESSIIYFEKLGSAKKKLLKFMRKEDPVKVFVESAYKAIERHIPEAKNGFGSHTELSKCIHQNH